MTVPEPPVGLAERGLEMWASLTAGRSFDAAWEVLVGEACRMADRLEKLDRLLRRDIDVWAAIEIPDGDSRMVLVFDDALAEARQLAGALRQLVVTLKLGVAVVDAPMVETRSALDDLAARRSSRISASSA